MLKGRNYFSSEDPEKSLFDLKTITKVEPSPMTQKWLSESSLHAENTDVGDTVHKTCSRRYFVFQSGRAPLIN